MVDLNLLLNYFKGKKVLITGHTGFKGTWLTYVLDQTGAKVLGYALPPNSNPNLFDKITFSNNFRSIIGDIRDYISLSRVVTDFQPDFVFHMAAQPLVLESYENPHSTHMINYVGTLNLLEILKTVKSRPTSVFITTDKVYRNLEFHKSFSEKDALGGLDPYSSSKAASEILIESYYYSFFKNNKLGLASVRAGNVIGGGDWSKNRLIPDIIRAHQANHKLVIRDKNSVRPWQHVLEPLFGYLNLAKKLKASPDKYSSAWNFGPLSNQHKTVNDVLNEAQINNIIPNVTFSNNEIKESKYLALNSDKAVKELGWKPKWNFKDTMKYTFSWYLNFNENEKCNHLLENDLDKYLMD